MDIFEIPQGTSYKKNIWFFISAGLLIIAITLLILLLSSNSSNGSYRHQLGGKAARIEELEDELQTYKDWHDKVVNAIDERDERIEELEDIIERAQRGMRNVSIDISFNNDSWMIMSDVDDVIRILNEY